MNILTKFGSNWPRDFGEEDQNVKGLQMTDDDGSKTSKTLFGPVKFLVFIQIYINSRI